MKWCCFAVFCMLVRIGLVEAQDLRPTFDIASMKINTSGEAAASTQFPPGGRFSAKNAPLKLLIRLAYGVADYQISGGPDWIRFNRFDVEGKSEANPTVEKLKVMLQHLLEDHFKLKVHRATKEDMLYALVVAKGGPKMRTAAGDEADLQRLRNDAWRGVKAGSGHLFTTKGEISGLAVFLTQILDRPVLDKTALEGLFAFDFALPTTIIPSPESPESIFEALQDQLGLRLDRTKGPIEVLVIDNVEQLIGN